MEGGETYTRRSIVASTYSLFDPLGFIAPFVMKAKILLQSLSRWGLGWGDRLEEDDQAQWKQWADDLPKLQALYVDRCFKPKKFGNVRKVQLHIFSDASRQGYSAVAYVRYTNEEEKVHCAFVIGKARLALLREISIPRLPLPLSLVRLSKIIPELSKIITDFPRSSRPIPHLS